MAKQQVLVFGMARSGIAAAALLSRQGAIVHITDAKTREELQESLQGLPEGIVYHLGEAHPEALLEGMDALVISPGIPIEHPAVVRAKALGILVLGEVELAYRVAHGLLTAITGTNGKTTTCTLLGEMFKNAGKNTHVVGNIGAPYAQIADHLRDDDVTVCEISSFQMESASKFHPHISAVLNITEDHLNRHHTMETYISLKERIFQNATEEDFVVLNWDDPITRLMASHTRAKAAYFSTKENVPFGAFLVGENLAFGTPEDYIVFAQKDDVYIPGEHNLQNALAASAIALLAGVPAQIVCDTLRTFQGVEHRIEFVREWNGVRFINDSKGTNVDSTIWAVRAMDRPTTIILGGYDKKTDFSPLCKEILNSKIQSAVLIGVTADQIARQLDEHGFHSWEKAGTDFPMAIQHAYQLTPKGGSVLLSPACASFDMFSDYESRGRIFKDIVNAL